MSQGSWRGFFYLSDRDFQLANRAYYAFCCSYMTRCCVLHVELRLLQLQSPFFCVFHFFLLLVVLIAFEGHNDIPELPPGMAWSCSLAALIVFQSLADSRIFTLFARESVVFPSAR
jgi:hypothetical protein